MIVNTEGPYLFFFFLSFFFHFFLILFKLIRFKENINILLMYLKRKAKTEKRNKTQTELRVVFFSFCTKSNFNLIYIKIKKSIERAKRTRFFNLTFFLNFYSNELDLKQNTDFDFFLFLINFESIDNEFQ